MGGSQIGGILFVLFGLLLLIGASSAKAEVFEFVWACLWVLLGLGSLIRGTRLGVDETEEGIAVVNPWRTYRYRWHEVDHFTTDWANGPLPYVVLKEGGRRQLQGIGGFVWSKPDNWSDQYMIDELNALLKDRSST